MKLPVYQIDAFASGVFAGNPAAVCPLEEWLDDATMQSSAAENNLSETAFFAAEGERWRLRWFTPNSEVELCGHATLASAFVILTELHPQLERVAFITHSGRLVVERDGDRFVMDFPAQPLVPMPFDDALARAMGGCPREMLRYRDHRVVLLYDSEAEVRALSPDMAALLPLAHFGNVATAPGDDCDFISRFFAPQKGVPEDPVTGSAHCSLVPYWGMRLGMKNVHARQVSARGGELFCEDNGERIQIAGHAVKYLEGTITI